MSRVTSCRGCLRGMRVRDDQIPLCPECVEELADLPAERRMAAISQYHLSMTLDDLNYTLRAILAAAKRSGLEDGESWKHGDDDD